MNSCDTHAGSNCDVGLFKSRQWKDETIVLSFHCCDLYNWFEEYIQIGPSYYHKRFLQFLCRCGRRYTDSETDVNLKLLTLSENGV